MSVPTIHYKQGPVVKPGDPEMGAPEEKSVLITHTTHPSKENASIVDVGIKSGEGKQEGMFTRFRHIYWNPSLDNKVLETEHQRHAFPQTRRRFRYGLFFIIFSSLAWCIFFALMQEKYWISFMSGCIVLTLTAALILAFTFMKVYQRYVFHTSIVISLLMCGFCLLSFVFDDPAMSRVGLFTGSLEILLLLYTVIPLPLYLCYAIGGVFTVLFETLSAVRVDKDMWPGNSSFISYCIGRWLLQLCIHILGSHFFVMAQVRERKTFLKVGQSMWLRQDLEKEKDLKKNMINSLMPSKVAEEVIQSREENPKASDEREPSSSPRSRNSRGHNDPKPQLLANAKMTFRSFHMSQMEHTSILFADIVGFTKMSSNKTAEHLVGLLNDLFGRFDIICNKSGCEKICTLGDCYYCVSGCPEPRADHAECCVEMGLGMVIAIEEFDKDHNEEVGMRVGVHTGTVLCGLVGTRRFKFDVWSHDVTIANLMESEGRAGTVHISETTYELVKDKYYVEEGEEIEDIRKHKTLIEYYNMDKQAYDIKHVQEAASIKTWFIQGRKSDASVKSPMTIMDNGKPELAIENGERRVPNVKNLTDQDETNTTMGDLGTRSDSMKDAIKGDIDQPTGNDALLSQLKRADDFDLKDQDILNCMRKESQVENYLHNPPINKFTLNFLRPRMEEDYRRRYLHTGSGIDGDDAKSAEAVSLPRWSACRDMVISFIFFMLISVCCFLNFSVRLPWLLFFIFATVSQITLLLPHLADVYFPSLAPLCLVNMNQKLLSWYPRHLLGVFIVSVPVAAVYSNFSCLMFENVIKSDLFYSLALTATLLHYCNFTVLSSWLKSTLATISGVVLLALIAFGVCSRYASESITAPIGNTNQSNLITDGVITPAYSSDVMTTSGVNNDTQEEMKIIFSDYREIFTGDHPLAYEIILNIALILLLIWFLNREFEISCRTSYHGDAQAQSDHQQMLAEKEQADWLLHNIIPEHVSNLLKQTAQYCQNHIDVGVVFATINNYDDFYDESYEGGKEYLRVLNELMGDFEELFDDPKYRDVEKIKTIGACLMVASGLNPHTRKSNKDPHAHLYALLDFSQELLNRLEAFNAEIFNFNFEMKIGFNFGEVTAGVIGTTKLLYDIWGDTVNVSSRMYSTGIPGKIQLTGACCRKLEDKYDFEYRGQIAVKGKGELDTFLLKRKKPGATWS